MKRSSIRLVDLPEPALTAGPSSDQPMDQETLLSTRRQWIRDRLQDHGREKPLRVLIASNSLAAGGAQQQILNMMPRLNELGLETEHFYYGGSKFFKPAFDQKQLVSNFLNRDRMGQLKFWKQTSAFFRQQQYDIAHAFTGTANFYARGAAVLARIPVIIGGWRGRVMADSLKERLPYSLLNLKTNAWIINSAANIDALDRLWFMKHLNTYIVRNGINFENRSSADDNPFDEEVNAWIAGRTIVGSVGRIADIKNIDLFLDSAKKLKHLSQKVCCCHIGRAEKTWIELEKHLQKRIEQEDLAGFVRLLGRSEKVPGFLSRIMVFVLTSDKEGCPNAVLEAMRASRPVVMTGCTDTKGLIMEGQNGYTVPVNDADALARHIEELASDPEKCVRFGEQGRILAEENFSAHTSAWHLARVYINEWEKKMGKKN